MAVSQWRFSALLVLAVLSVCSAGPLVAGKNPVQLFLSRVSIHQNETTLENGEKGYVAVTEPSEKKSRSQPLLFQQALGIEPGKPYVFDYPKWRMLETCGLFRDLSATTKSNDGQLTTIITGTEVPSITFQPSVQLGASLDNPEINGGVLLRDNNFRGLGERFELIVSAFKEGLEKGVGELPPSFNVKWIDGIKGRPNSVTACWDEDYGLEDAKDLTMRTLPSTAASERIQVMKRNVKVTFDGVRTLGEAAGSFLKGSGLVYSVEPFQCETRPLKEGKNAVEGSTLSGAKMVVTHYPKPSLKLWPSIGVTHEVGVNTRESGGKDRYQTLGVDITSQNMVIKETITTPATKTTPPDGHVTFARLKLKNLLTRGAGRVPLHHLANFDDPRYLRGYSEPSAWRFGSSADDAMSNRKRAFSVLKAEVANSGLFEWGVPGVFLDAALFRDAVKGSDGLDNSWGLHSTTGLSAQMAVGMSVKSSGFRLDLGWPLRKTGLKPRLYLGPDTGDL